MVIICLRGLRSDSGWDVFDPKTSLVNEHVEMERQPAKSGCSKFSISRSTGRKYLQHKRVGNWMVIYFQMYILFIYVCMYVFIYSFIDSFVHLFTYWFIYLSINTYCCTVAIKDAEHLNTSGGFQLVTCYWFIGSGH